MHFNTGTIQMQIYGAQSSSYVTYRFKKMKVKQNATLNRAAFLKIYINRWNLQVF